MLFSIAMIIIGLIILLVAGELLVRGAVDLASALKVPALLISLTIVAFGTSAPELIVSIQAVLNNTGGIALGNIIGSNIANVLMVLGFPAIVYPISSSVPGLRPHAIVMALATLVFAYGAFIVGEINFLIGLILFVGLITYLSYMLLTAKNGDHNIPVLDEIDEFTDGGGLNISTITFLIAGLIGLPVGAHLLVTYGAELARSLGARDAIIGLTIIAFGTSLPELATVFSAALKKKADVAIGSIIGSNIFNLLAVGGVTGLVGGASFDQASLTLDIPVMLGATLLLIWFVLTKRNISKPVGIVMGLSYIIFIAYLANTSGL